MTFDRLAFTWQISDYSGWGVYGWNLAAELARRGSPRPLPLASPGPMEEDPLRRLFLAPLVAEAEALRGLALEHPNENLMLDNAVVLHHLGRDLVGGAETAAIRGHGTAGVVFLEETRISSEGLGRSRRYDTIVAGSTWNGDVLRARGIDNVVTVLQGIDTVLFRPQAGGKRLFRDRFVVFSGGKLEFRKGQDIVLAAFRAFYRRHPDALLVTLWRNNWPATSDTIVRGGHVNAPPELDGAGHQDLAGWAEAHGVPRRAFIDLGFVPNPRLPSMLREMDAAVFPNRCEGGTNLVAMECMACGLPVVLSANTGHLDLVNEERCLVLAEQPPVPGADDDTQGWGESAVEDLLECLETLYTSPSTGRRLGKSGAAWAAGLAWRDQVEKLLAALTTID